MSQENHEQRIAELENKVAKLDLITKLTGSVLIKTVEDGLLHSKKIIAGREDMGVLIDIILQLHPELRTDKLVGSIHTKMADFEIKEEAVDELLKKLKAIFPAD